MQEFNNTQYFNIKKEQEKIVKDVIARVYNAIEEKGYNPVNQFIGYIMSGDPTYITRHENVRGIVRKVERDELLEEILGY